MALQQESRIYLRIYLRVDTVEQSTSPGDEIALTLRPQEEASVRPFASCRSRLIDSEPQSTVVEVRTRAIDFSRRMLTRSPGCLRTNVSIRMTVSVQEDLSTKR